ncbi:MAG: exo-beta-N-acetylmuramidase NamZ family protein, partial [Nannocystaceae bacterium]
MDVRTGTDRLAAGEGPSLTSAPVAVLCHPASVDRNLVPVQEVLRRRGARIVSLLGPEHGIDAAAQDMEGVEDHAPADVATPVYSLYGDEFESLRPTPAMFHDAAWLVVDLQDVGARYYTYVWTALMAVEEALKCNLRVLILDRPNPLGGTDAWVEGGRVEPGEESFVGFHDVAVRHGMTLAEIVTMAIHERGVEGTDRVTVLECAGWDRGMLFSETGLPWVLPSPNMPTLETALVYPGQCLLEGTNFSEGRGTTRPFELFGAPFIDGEALRGDLSPADFPGLGLRVVHFKPTFQKHQHASCGGLQLHVRAPREVRSLRSSYALLAACWNRWPESCDWRTERYEFVDDRPAIDLLAGGRWLRDMVESGAQAADMV